MPFLSQTSSGVLSVCQRDPKLSLLVCKVLGETLLYIGSFKNLQCGIKIPLHLAIHGPFFLLEAELDVHLTCGFSDHVKLLVLWPTSIVPLFIHVLPIVFRNDSGYRKVVASSSSRNFLRTPSQPD